MLVVKGNSQYSYVVNLPDIEEKPADPLPLFWCDTVFLDYEFPAAGSNRKADSRYKAPTVEERGPIGLGPRNAFLIFDNRDFIPPGQKIGQDLVPATGREDTHRLKDCRLTNSVLAGEQSHTAQTWNRQIINTSKTLYREVR